jgi:hypothetical protein
MTTAASTWLINNNTDQQLLLTIYTEDGEVILESIPISAHAEKSFDNKQFKEGSYYTVQGFIGPDKVDCQSNYKLTADKNKVTFSQETVDDEIGYNMQQK